MFIGKGNVTSMSRKKKLNTTSSTEVEVVAAHNLSAQLLWTQYFIEAQGFKTEDNILHEYNQSAMIPKKTERN